MRCPRKLLCEWFLLPWASDHKLMAVKAYLCSPVWRGFVSLFLPGCKHDCISFLDYWGKENLWRNTQASKRCLFSKQTFFFKTFFFLSRTFIYLFIYWLHWVFIAARGLSLVAASRGYSLLRCMGFSLQWLLLLWALWALGMRASVAAAHGLSSFGSRALERRRSSCGIWA